jgi:hypothetical protein
VREIWQELVAQVPAAHFRPSDEHLIEAYAQAVALGRRAYGELAANGPVIKGRASPWLVVLEKAHRSARIAIHHLCPNSKSKDGVCPWSEFYTVAKSPLDRLAFRRSNSDFGCVQGERGRV